MAKKSVTQVLTEVIDLFSKPENIDKLEDTVKKTAIKIAGIPSENYSFRNQFLLALQGTADARGHKQWKSVGRSVFEWSKQVTILAPSIRKIKDEKTGETEDQLIGFRTIGLYAVENTYGRKLETPENNFKLPRLVHVAEKLNCKVSFANTSSKYWGYFQHGKSLESESRIVLGTEEEGTFFHELTHLVQYKLDGKLKGGQDPTQEIIAQLSACVLARMYGFKIDNDTYQYISHYAKSKKPEVVARKCFEISQKVSEIITEIIRIDQESKQLPMLYIPQTA